MIPHEVERFISSKFTLFHGRFLQKVPAEGNPHRYKLRMGIEVKPTYLVDADPVAPHGLLGQTYDRDSLEVNGRRDSYDRLDDGKLTATRSGAGGHVTTRANLEGAIEGSIEDYRLASSFATAKVCSGRRMICVAAFTSSA